MTSGIFWSWAFEFTRETSPYVCGLALVASALMLGWAAWDRWRIG